MSKESASYFVIKCNECDFFFGKHKNSKFSCTRCGEFQIKPQIFGRTNDTEELHRLVSLNNIPEELRDDFEKLDRKKEIKKTTSDDLKLIPLILIGSSSENGEIELENIKNFLIKNKYTINFEKVIQVAELEGLISRISNEKWLLLG